MATSGILPTGTTNGAAQGTSTTSNASGGLNGLSTADFLNLFITQLQNQDPLNPTSSNDFLTQTAQFSQVQGITQLNQNITQMLSFQQLTQGADLIGKKVSYLASDGSGSQSGTVSGVKMVNGQAQLTVGSANVALSQVQTVTGA
ncbi:MAG TPA: flagellar hook capping FlgD N-terminal domain-containing protein [Gemmataceae bacterium]|nr:flagellar hook capping FlgD N-terminal domain-containing protein [Gemmataceae bacterium]